MESNAASAAEKNAVVMKQIKRKIICMVVLEISNGGSMNGSLFNYNKNIALNCFFILLSYSIFVQLLHNLKEITFI